MRACVCLCEEGGISMAGERVGGGREEETERDSLTVYIGFYTMCIHIF